MKINLQSNIQCQQFSVEGQCQWAIHHRLGKSIYDIVEQKNCKVLQEVHPPSQMAQVKHRLTPEVLHNK